jgi:2-hydroxy-6-oxo-octa-2,4-dienoate hydrolase
VTETRPEVGNTVDASGIATNYLDSGEGPVVVLVHGSGPGVTGYANWRMNIPFLAQRNRVIVPDMAGFGYSARPEGLVCDVDVWAEQVVAVLDALGVERASIVGNSFGGAIALRVAIRNPERVDSLVLMGSVGVPFPITEGLDAVWGYEPSVAAMRRLLQLFVWNRELATEDLAELRHRASIEPGFQESFAALFPTPRQRWVDALTSPDEQIRALKHPTLVIHGREDRIIPLGNSLRLAEMIDGAHLHVFGHCGHWSQIEQKDAFNRLVSDFLADLPPAVPTGGSTIPSSFSIGALGSRGVSAR